MKPWHLGMSVVGLLLIAALWLWHAVEAQRPKGSDETQIRSLISTCAKAAMRRDSNTINHYISDNYKDGFGLNAERARLQVGRVLGTSREVQVFIPMESELIQIETDRKQATAQFLLQFHAIGSQAGDLPFNGTLTLRLKKEPVRYFAIFPGAEWRIAAAEGYTPGFFD